MLVTDEKTLLHRIAPFVKKGWQVQVENGYIYWCDPNSSAFIKVALSECPLCYIIKYNIVDGRIKH